MVDHVVTAEREVLQRKIEAGALLIGGVCMGLCMVSDWDVSLPVPTVLNRDLSTPLL